MEMESKRVNEKPKRTKIEVSTKEENFLRGERNRKAELIGLSEEEILNMGCLLEQIGKERRKKQ